MIKCPRNWQGCSFEGATVGEVAQHIADVHKPAGRTAAQLELMLRQSMERIAKDTGKKHRKGRRAA